MLKVMSAEEYFAADAISKSGLDQIAVSPAHYRAWVKQNPKATPAMIFGTAAHTALLEPEKFDTNYGECDLDGRTKAYAEWVQNNPGKMALKSDVFNRLKQMQESFQSHEVASKVLKGAQVEQSVFWTDEETGEPCKSRPDIITSEGIVVDFKTTDDARLDPFAKSCANYRYHVQAAMYLEGISKALSKPLDTFMFIAMEKDPPYAIGVYLADHAFVMQGKALMRRDLSIYSQCKKSNQWPGYPHEIQVLNLPRWST